MKKAVLFLSLLLISITTFANFGINEGESTDPVSWKTELLLTGENELTLKFTATIEDHWHVYSSTVEEGGPIPTSIGFDEISGAEKKGEILEEGKLVTEFDKNFNMDLKWYSNSVVFYQKLSIKSKPYKIKGYLKFMTCDDKQCLPPTYVEFDYTEKDAKPLAKEESGGLILLFITCFGFGLVALLTPCVFPMIPLTVSFFTKQSKTRSEGIRKSIIYGVSIITIYVAIGMLITIIFGENALNAMSTNAWVNLSFFILFVVFAASFFGAFEIRLPNSWINNADQASHKGGLVGIFFMAFTLSLISFSCTGPIIGTLLVEAASHGGYLGPAIGMFGFSAGLALPFTLFALFPSWLNSLPKSGGWLNSVKVVLGFIELALSLKFLSTADLVMHWGFLDREVFIALWITISILLALYLLGKLKFSHDSDIPYISVPRLFMAIASLSFAIYLIPGLWGAPLKAISGFLPHMGTQDFNIISSHGTNHKSSRGIEKKNAEGLHCPHGIDCFFDYDQALEIAKTEGKPLLIDFTGQGCVNCRKMEASVWSDPEVLNILNNDVILTSLYVDDPTELEEVYTNEEGKKLRTIGDRWSDFQSKRFKTQSQPYYILLDPNTETELVTPRAYNEDIPEYLTWLKEAINKLK